MSAGDRNSGSGTAVATAPLRTPSMPPATSPPGRHPGQGMAEGFGQTERTDAWWLIPVAQALGLLVLIGYANYAAILGAAHYHYVENGRDYLSPFYSPYIHPAWLPAWLSPALLILVFPLGFRTTCYYYRKAYYRSFFADPMGCAVGERAQGLLRRDQVPVHPAEPAPLLPLRGAGDPGHPVDGRGEGVHLSRIPDGPTSGDRRRLARDPGLRTVSLTLYTFSCHSLRHLVGGKLDCFSCAVAGGPRHKAWSAVSVLNEHHMGFAWLSLFVVCFADFYVRHVLDGRDHDPMFVTFRPVHTLTTSPE